MAAGDRPLTKIADAFKELADSLNSPNPRLEVSQFVRACRLISPLIGFLGIAFKFAEIEFSAKVDNVMEASRYVNTLDAMIDREIGLNCAKTSKSHSRNLVRVKRSIDMLKVIFEQILARRGNSILGPVSTAYQQVFAPYHGWAVRTAVSASLPTLPTKARLMRKLNEKEATVNVQMQNFVVTSAPIIQYIENLFHSRVSGDEILGLI
ncbi:accelerated cell death 11-like [Vitis riparia]|uniref:accelerated cell death 11-like n=1 Tax=Vitis riparia TaxID=96939 RepID=UPI00155A4CBF|nr:accelerated cell death 11-like [Vitis riparia]